MPGGKDKRNVIARAIIAARTGSARLERMASRLEARQAQLEEKVEECIIRGDREMAERLAVEAAQLKDLRRRVLYLQAVIDKLRMRLETAYEAGELTSSLRGIMDIVGRLRGQELAAIPEVGITLGEIEESLRSLGAPYYAAAQPYSTLPVSSDAYKILEEAQAVAEERMKEKLTKL